MAKRKPLPPRVKRMKRADRLAWAKSWLPTFTGKNVLRGYCNQFGVDWRCAAAELKMLGIEIDPAYLVQREKAEVKTIRMRSELAKQRKAAADQHWHPYTEPHDALLAGDYAALHELEQRQLPESETSLFQSPRRRRRTNRSGKAGLVEGESGSEEDS